MRALRAENVLGGERSGRGASVARAAPVVALGVAALVAGGYGYGGPPGGYGGPPGGYGPPGGGYPPQGQPPFPPQAPPPPPPPRPPRTNSSLDCSFCAGLDCEGCDLSGCDGCDLSGCDGCDLSGCDGCDVSGCDVGSCDCDAERVRARCATGLAHHASNLLALLAPLFVLAAWRRRVIQQEQEQS